MGCFHHQSLEGWVWILREAEQNKTWGTNYLAILCDLFGYYFFVTFSGVKLGDLPTRVINPGHAWKNLVIKHSDDDLSYSYTGLKGSFGSSCSRCSILLIENRFNATMGQCHSPSQKKTGKGFYP